MKKTIYLLLSLAFLIGCTTNDNISENNNSEIITANLQSLTNYVPCYENGTCFNVKTWDTLVYSGADKINIVFIAEGFKKKHFPPTGNLLVTYNALVDSTIVNLFAREPFASNLDDFNIFTYRIVNGTLGISTINHPYNPVTPITVNSNWNVFKNKAGLERYLGILDTDRARLQDSLTHSSYGYLPNKRVFGIIICNDPQYLGGADLPSMFASDYKLSLTMVGKSTQNEGDFDDLVIHEFLHSFADLDDEYWEDAGDPTGDTASPINSAYAIKHYENDLWIHSNRPNIKDTNPGGWFPGGRYISSGKFRETDASIMRYVNQPITTSQQGYIQTRIDDEL